MSITVVIPTLNTRPEFLAEALASVLAQSLPADEIIIVNNGEAQLEPPSVPSLVRVVNMVHRAGVAQARNLGASIASGAFVSFLDDDDLWDVDYLEKIAARFAADHADCLVGRLDRLADGIRSGWKNPDGQLTVGVILRRNPGITGSSLNVRRSAFLEASGFDPALTTGEDKALVLEMILRGLTVGAVPDAGAVHRVHALGSLSSARHMANGIDAFYRKYARLMSFSQKLENRWKICRYRSLAGDGYRYAAAAGVLGIARKVLSPLYAGSTSPERP